MPVFLSVLIPVYNVEKFLPRCLDSLLNQQLPADVEVVCVDDGSTDRSGELCDAYAQRDSHVRVIHQDNKGLGGARNSGMKAAHGEYVAFIDSDDYVSDDWYSKIRVTLEREKCDILFFNYSRIESTIIKKCRAYKTKSGYINRDELLFDIVSDVIMKSAMWQMSLKRELFCDIEFPENRMILEDYAVMPQILLKAESIYYLNESLYYYCIRESSLTQASNCDKRLRCYQLAVERYEYLRSLGYPVSRMGCWVMALFLCRNCGTKEAPEKERMCRAMGKRIIRENLCAILRYRRCPWTFKLRFILASVGLYDFAIRTYLTLNKIRRAIGF